MPVGVLDPAWFAAKTGIRSPKGGLMDFETKIAIFFAVVGVIFSFVWLVVWGRGIHAARELTAELRARRQAPGAPKNTT